MKTADVMIGTSIYMQCVLNELCVPVDRDWLTGLMRMDSVVKCSAVKMFI